MHSAFVGNQRLLASDDDDRAESGEMGIRFEQVVERLHFVATVAHQQARIVCVRVDEGQYAFAVKPHRYRRVVKRERMRNGSCHDDADTGV